MLGSVLNSTYADSVESSVSGLPILEAARGAITDSLAAAIQVAQQVGGPAGGQLAEAARRAFVEGMGVATLTAVGLMLAAMVAVITLPNKAEHPELMTERAGSVMNSNQLRSSERSRECG